MLVGRMIHAARPAANSMAADMCLDGGEHIAEGRRTIRHRLAEPDSRVGKSFAQARTTDSDWRARDCLGPDRVRDKTDLPDRLAGVGAEVAAARNSEAEMQLLPTHDELLEAPLPCPSTREERLTGRTGMIGRQALLRD